MQFGKGLWIIFIITPVRSDPERDCRLLQLLSLEYFSSPAEETAGIISLQNYSAL